MTNKPAVCKPPPDAEVLPMRLADASPLSPADSARDVLGDYLAYASFVAHGNPVAAAVQWTGAPLEVHAARLAAELVSVLAELTALRRRAGVLR
jgi:hypothetical protein